MKSRMLDFLENNKWKLLLFYYHLVFIVFAYQLRVIRGISDAHFYWAQNFSIDNFSWWHYAHYGTDFILFINYPFIQLGLPFWFGFLLYGIVGFFGVLKWIQWVELVVGQKIYYKGFNVLYLFFLFPSLHFWTANLGKEPLIFWGIAAVFYAVASANYKSFSFITGSLLLVIIRPHVALMLLLAIGLVMVFQKRFSFKKRLALALVGFSVFAALFYMVLQLTQIRYLDWKRIQYFNEFSILSFRNSGTYVPMLDYNFANRFFAFNFRPLFFDAKSLLGFLASIENALLLLIYLLTFVVLIVFYKKIIFPQWMKIAFLFALIASLLYIQRYANLGIFMRTKIMFQPFVLIALFCIIKQGIALRNYKS
ncbi:hypothetical protein [Flavobacterium phycosphaerae]|uniref:hypothetical protein n=1 Tax=Flavobacterium phycosphaerae TaxID=2697515 RepID=UPI001389C21B|nr:hypothetical protein [Flavobacterium phycosphaerae]